MRPMTLPIGPADYYELLPGLDQYPGDIWCDLPTLGVLAQKAITGIVVTPACDLTNHKAETITYLPVISVRRFVSSISFLPVLKRALSGQLTAAGLAGLIDFDRGHTRPALSDIAAAQVLVEQELAAESAGSGRMAALVRSQNGLALIERIVSGTSVDADVSKAKGLLGQKEFTGEIRSIVQNGRGDTHFLPADGQDPSWSGLPEQSVALFRYPITVPAELLALANDTPEASWSEQVSQLTSIFPCSPAFSQTRPTKRLRVKPRFMHDLISRYTAVFARLGSPDFTSERVQAIVAEIGAEP